MVYYILQPLRMLSSPTILKRQKGNCFEYSTLLCCLLIGAGYDAFVVSGYANRETCLMDETRETCPLLKKKEEASTRCVLCYKPCVKKITKRKYQTSLFRILAYCNLIKINIPG